MHLSSNGPVIVRLIKYQSLTDFLMPGLKAIEINNCMLKNQFRLVPCKSINGLHKGFMTQGKYNKLVYNPMSSLLTPRFLYIKTETEMMMTYGKPEAKFNKGIQYQGLLSVFILVYFGWLI